MSLTNKVALVTGAGSGIGAAIAIKFTAEGARLSIVDKNEIALRKTSNICENLTAKPLTIIADVSKDEDAKRIINETLNFYGRLDILVNSAGIGNCISILDENAMSVYDKVICTNLRAAVTMTHLAAKYLLETKGNIINISSVAAYKVISGTIFSYGISKAALDHFTRNIAFELASKGVRVNAINPGAVKTNIIENTGEVHDAELTWNELKKYTGLNRIADPDEVADLAAYLASDKSRSITGSTLLCDNGSKFFGAWEE